MELQPVQFGICIPMGKFSGKLSAHLEFVEAVSPIPVQIEPAIFHPDGSCQWAVVDVLLPGAAQHSAGAHVVIQEADDDAAVECGVFSNPNSVVITNVTQRLKLSLDDGQLSLSEVDSNQPIFRERGIEIELIDRHSNAHQPRWHSLRQDTTGRIRNTFVIEGVIGQKRSPLNLSLKLSFHSGTGLIKSEVCLHNPRRARHPGGIWDLGDPESELFQDLSVRILHPFNRGLLQSWSIDEHNRAEISECVRLHLYQDSSGGENWDSRAHINREERVPCQFRGYRLEVDGNRIFGDRATPVSSVGFEQCAIGIAVPEFWQQFPKSLEVDHRCIRLGLFPSETDDLHELQGGERKNFTFWLNIACGPAALVYAAQQLRPVMSRLVITPSRMEYAQHGHLSDGTDILAEDRASLDRLLNLALDSDRSLYNKREEIDEYGWRHYGELVADHEERYYDGPLPLVSHFNNQFDPIYGFLLNYLRTGDKRLLELGDALARHVVDIDIYHTEQDKWGFNGGLFWHSDHYRDAHTATHRSYSKANIPQTGDYGGGPCSEHNYTTGLFLHYCLTGRTESRDAVIGLADWVINMDDGSRSAFRFITSGPTGLASATREETFHGPGRGAGNSLNALLDGWRITGDEKYLDYAEIIVRRCIHPGDDIEQHDLLNAEDRWSYTVFLTSLLKYLKLKSHWNQLDENYQYARAGLIHYAEWMSEHERPYFDCLHELEFPTETWPAQDLRKANVLRHAAAYLSEPVRRKCFVRGERIAQRAWQDLWSFETASCARPLSILMVEGLKELLNPSTSESGPDFPTGTQEFGETKRFVGQKTKVKQLVKKPWLLWKEIIPE